MNKAGQPGEIAPLHGIIRLSRTGTPAKLTHHTMKNHKMRAFTPLFLLIIAGIPTLRANLVDLYFQPDVHSPQATQAAPDDPRLGQPAPVMDEAKAALGWHYAEYTDSVRAYIQDARIGKDLLPVENAILYSAPSAQSPVLGVFRKGDPLKILDTGEWWTLEVHKAFPVYFVLDTPAPLPPVTAAATEPLEELPAAATWSAAPVTPVIEERPVVDEPARAPEVPVAATAPARTQRTAAPPGLTGQRYEGVFKRSKRTLGLFAPKAPFHLEGAGGRRLAWVDTSGIVLPGSLNAYIDQVVIIHGERDMLSPSKDWIIRARNMRLR